MTDGMKHSLFFWSRTIHCWVGLYLGAVTVVWLGEVVLLPAVLAPEMAAHAPEATDGASAIESEESLKESSVQTVLARFLEERVKGAVLQPESVTYLPDKNVWIVRDRRHYVTVTYDAATGSVLERNFDAARLVEEKNGLSWLSPRIGALLKSTFHPLFIVLCVTGLHLLIGKKKFLAQSRRKRSWLSSVLG